jgi:hypothetical protein
VAVVCGLPLTTKTAAGPVVTFCSLKLAGVATPAVLAVTS